MRKASLAALGVVLVLVTCGAQPTWALTFTCATVATRGSVDPEGAVFRSRFAEPAINLQGDVVFAARASGAPKRVYLYPGAGAPSVVAAAGDPAPGGGVFSDFRAPSINDDGDIAFRAGLFTGQGVFVRQAGGSLVKVAATGDAAPGGGTFATFRALSRVNAAGDVAFIAEISGGSAGAFRYASGAAAVTPIARAGDATGDGRRFCSFLDVDLGDSGMAVLQVLMKVDCTDIFEASGQAIYRQSGGGLTTVAEAGLPTPIAGTTYGGFFGAEANAADKVGFRARVDGVVPLIAIFLFDPAGPSTVSLARTGETAPTTGGGTLRTIPRTHLTDADQAAFRGRVWAGIAHHGIFLFDTTAEAVVLDTHPVPSDRFGAGAVYRRIDEEFGIDRSGARLTFTAKIRDSVAPASKIGLFRCTGS